MHQKLSPPKAADLMQQHVKTIAPDLSLRDAIQYLLKHGVSNAPVVESTSEGPSPLLGFLSEQDCLEFLANEIFYGSPYQQQTVRTMMKRHPVCIGPETDGFSLASLFVSHGYHTLPVVDEQNRLLGIVRRHDVLKALDHYYNRAVEEYGLEHFPPDLREVANLRFVLRND